MIPNTCSHAAAIACLIRASSGFRSIRPRSRLSPRAPMNPLLIRVVPQHARADVADERHRGQPQHPARDEHGDAGRVGERRRDPEAVRDDDELALSRAARARGSTRSCSSRARRPRPPRRAPPPPARPPACGRPRSGAAVSNAISEWPRCSGRTPPRTRATSPCRARSERSLRIVTSETENYLRKFRNRKRIARLEQAQDCLAYARLAVNCGRGGLSSLRCVPIGANSATLGVRVSPVVNTPSVAVETKGPL